MFGILTKTWKGSAMHAAMRPYVTAGVALVGASVIAVTPIAPAPPDIRIANPALRLAAAVVPGPIAAITNIPANFVEALQDFTDSNNIVGPDGNMANLWIYGPLNYGGWDPGDPAELAAIAGILLPFPALAGPLADQLNALLVLELPNNLPDPVTGCQGHPGDACTDLTTAVFYTTWLKLVSTWFRVGPLELLQLIGEPVEIPDATAPGGIRTVIFDPLEPIRSFVTSLTTPAEIKPLPSIQTVVTTVSQVVTSSLRVLNPFVSDNFVLLSIKFILDDLLHPSFGPNSVTSIPLLSPKSGQMLTIDAAPVVTVDELDKTKAPPTSVDPTSVDPTSVDPTSVDPTSVDPTSVTGDEIDTPESSQDSKRPLINVLRPSLNASPGAGGDANTSTGSGTEPVRTAIRSTVDSISNAVKNTLGSLGGQDSGPENSPASSSPTG